MRRLEELWPNDEVWQMASAKLPWSHNVILLKIIAMRQQPWRQVELAEELAISRAEVSNSLDRCLQVGLIDEDKRTPHKATLLEFIQYGLKYIFAAKPGPMVRGILTAHAAPPLSSHTISQRIVTVSNKIDQVSDRELACMSSIVEHHRS